jgi:hypothetical protein
MDTSRIHCPYTECVTTFSKQKDASRHAKNHDKLNQKEGRLNIYACEVCNTFFVKINELNIHQQRIHKFSEAVKKSWSNKPLIAILYRGSYKTIYFDGCINKRYRSIDYNLKMSTFYSRVVILEALKLVGTYQAVFKFYKSKELNGELTWTSVEVGSKFTVTSLRENCTSCALFFNSALAFLEHMKTLKHTERLATVSPFGGGICAPNEERSVDVLKRWFDIEINNSIKLSKVSDNDMNESIDSSQKEIDDHFDVSDFDFDFDFDVDHKN